MLGKRYHPAEVEPRLNNDWQQSGVYHFSLENHAPVFSIDTPPPTVSGKLHLGHVYSYSHTDFIARFRRMNGYQVFYPMGYDDNGLPTERLVEQRLGITAAQVGRATFIEKCLNVSEEAEKEYQALWQRLGLSIDWRYTYRTIDEFSRRTSQKSFIDLYRKGLAYRREAPAIWCPECHTSIAQAELNDLERQSELFTLAFRMENGDSVPIATTRPELLPACVAVFVHPDDARYQHLLGRALSVPLFNQQVPVIADPAADPQKGTGVVMCCTFGDSTDVTWWYTHNLPLIEVLDQYGRMTNHAGELSGLRIAEARQQIVQTLQEKEMLLGRQSTLQTVRVHERCDTPVETIIARQWFIRVLDFKQTFLKAGDQVNWHPQYMRARYQAWVENLNWDWCISRQRYFGVPFPLWYCAACGEIILADESLLPIDPIEQMPSHPCGCGSKEFIPETDIMDTWATSSLSPQIAGRWLDGAKDPSANTNNTGNTLTLLYQRVYPFSMRPQAHEIIRTWAFYTIVKSHHHFGQLPWKTVLISGWGLAGEGMGKISKSRGGGPLSPLEMIERYSADAVRYWAASTSPGKDAIISEEKIQLGSRLVTKLWNVARFCQGVLQEYTPPQDNHAGSSFTPADRWILARLNGLIQSVTELFLLDEYAAAKSETEDFFWHDLADNYLEMCKQRLYEPGHTQAPAARFTLYHTLLTLLRLFAPILPYVTEEIYQGLIAVSHVTLATSIHAGGWPSPNPAWSDPLALETGEILLKIATAVRRYKSERSLPLGSEAPVLQVAVKDDFQAQNLLEAIPDLLSVTRARQVQVVSELEPGMELISLPNTKVQIAFLR